MPDELPAQNNAYVLHTDVRKVYVNILRHMTGFGLL